MLNFEKKIRRQKVNGWKIVGRKIEGEPGVRGQLESLQPSLGIQSSEN